MNPNYYPEQDESGDGDLPTYGELAAQKGPNSRFGRWKNWVEKRAAERYIDLTPDERARRRERGWGEDVYAVNQATETLANMRLTTTIPQLHPSASYASFWSGNTAQATSLEPPSYYPPRPEPPLVLPAGQPLLPSHLKVHQFGSRFLPHTTSPMNALLPLMGDRLLLIGHDKGLSVLDMFPSDDPSTSSPADAQVHPIWEGEGVYQLELLEFQETGDATPQGVVLALIGAEVESQGSLRERDVLRSIRMYNLSSLTSLARWAKTQKNTKPLDLRRPPSWNPQLTPKKHKHNSSINKLKSFISDSGTSSEPPSSYPSSSSSSRPLSTLLKRETSTSSIESSWDLVDELPLRWATDFIPLASSGSRLLHQNVLFFELQRSSAPGARGVSSLAVAIKQSILLYETPKNERAFRFVKEFYTPLVPRNLSFVYQCVQDTVLLRSPSSSSQRSGHLIDGEAVNRRFSFRQSFDTPRGSERAVASSSNDYGAQMSLFVVFDKKAGLIRLADSAVLEVEPYENSPRDIQSPSGLSPRRSFIRESKGYWLPPSVEELPIGYPGRVTSKPVYILTRGKQTQIVPYPIPSSLSSTPPLHTLTWNYTPSHICHRICSPLDEPYFLQVIALGEYGIEVQEVPMSVFTHGKGKSRCDEPIRAEIDIGGDIAYLCRGGQWHEPQRYLTRSDSFMSYSSASTVRPGRQSSEDGFYATVRKGAEDWRVIWLGGTEKEDTDSTDM